MDPHNEIKTNVDYQAVLSDMNINKDEIPINNNEASSNTIQSIIRNDKNEKITDDNNLIESTALNFHTTVKTVRKKFPISSYSSSDDDNDFYDADEPIDVSVFSAAVNQQIDEKTTMNDNQINETSLANESQIPFEIYEAAYDEGPEEDLAPIDGTIISHLISQVRNNIYYID
ncbi:unnamed protein product [Rotaria sp. Silwood2]|nr:unnamed protein product [Rotaria sp. Silwood2]